MPPVIFWAAGAVGAVAAVNWVIREARRINAELHPEQYGAIDDAGAAKPAAHLRRDAAGIYRPD